VVRESANTPENSLSFITELLLSLGIELDRDFAERRRDRRALLLV
jgi:hypothetical protein